MFNYTPSSPAPNTTIGEPCVVLLSRKILGQDDFRSLPDVATLGKKRKKPVVLVADDEPLIVRTLVQILQGEGYEAVGTKDGLEAVTQAEGLKPDLLLLDVVMPRLNGVEAAKRINSFSPTSRIVLLSGQASSMDLLQGVRSQGLDFEIIAKPIKPEVLLTIIRQLLE